MHPLRQCKTVHCAGHLYVRKQHIYRDTIQDADCLSELAASMTSKPASRRLRRRCQAQEDVVFDNQHNRRGRRLLLRHGPQDVIHCKLRSD